MWASGGFMADTECHTQIYSKTQQQFGFRNVTASSWQLLNCWACVFADSPNTLDSCKLAKSFTHTPSLKSKPSKPFLTEVGVSFAGGFISFDDILIVSPTTVAGQINNSAARCILFPSGHYSFDGSIEITKKCQVVLGVGWPVLHVANSTVPFINVSASNAVLAGLLFELGAALSVDSMITLAKPGVATSMFDISCRLLTPPNTGTAACKVMVQVDQDSCYLENLWLWVADHQPTGATDWTRMQNPTGLAVTGADVTAFGLQVEHQIGTGVVWNGLRGACYFFQSEFPYEAVADQTTFYSTTDPAHTLAGAGFYALAVGGGATNSNLTAVTVPNKSTSLSAIQSLNINGGPSTLKHAVAYSGDGSFLPQAPIPASAPGTLSGYALC
jgi:hypothetical protein